MRNRRLVLEHRAHLMRRAPTFTEARLWSELSAGKLGTPFRRKAIVGGFIADFLAPARKLIVEIDGLYHTRRIDADARRDRKLARLGYRILRLPEELVRTRIEEAVALIAAALAQPP